ncbi:AAA family ATPase [Pseudomonas sp. PA-6-1D]|uniref:nucleotide-binding protein n=1 Tax=Pseudomonas TaxID=286 RepID=UPI001EF06FD0|nr:MULTISPECIES: AAA family ATPase [Pseudomonas]MCF5141173.1 AAA family ATPase [Pseudomonas sp. PA-6-3C]MCF5145738.1 AAA family ATPase [Pseudomonas sp. PA-6-3F]MCF5157964.1 AAA family ATPase [Pseudomonas sp. PA-6-2E]MCF5174204.1 AAA family ATPase [Pseudomonas sp. PA-6-1D]MCF5192525.1 AAA family ATPase [Pseudomonas sp. PA-6-1H]
MMNAVLLKRAMKYLDLSGVALAEKVSALREDGKRTAPETISRWLNGTRPVDPFLMGWIAELVRSKLMTQDDARVRLPNEGLVIAVANMKGGVGKTTVSRNLAAIAKSLRLKSTYLYADYPQSVQAARQVRNRLEALRINCPELTPEEILAYTPSAGEVVVVDVSNGIARDSFLSPENPDDRLKVHPAGFLGRFQPDIYLVPGEFTSSLDNWSLKGFLDSDILQAPVQLLHRPSFMSMDFATTASTDGFDVTSDLFCPFFIPQSVSASAVLPQDVLSDWQNLDQKHHHFKLFEHLLELLGGEIMDSFDVMQSVKSAPLSELLDLAQGG